MTIEELKAFIDGMDIEKAPTPKQWARIVEKLGETFSVAPIPSYPTGPSPYVPYYVPSQPWVTTTSQVN